MSKADKIKSIRERTGLNRKEFSEYAGIPLRTLEDWEAGRRNPPEYIPRLLEYMILYKQMVAGSTVAKNATVRTK